MRNNKLLSLVVALSCFIPVVSFAKEDVILAAAAETYNKAVRFYEIRRWDAAKDYFHVYLAEYSDTPLYVTCLYYLAYCYAKLGDQRQAILLYHKVIDQAKGEDAFWGQMAQKRLQDLNGL